MKIENRRQLLLIVAITAAALFIGDKMIFSPLTASWKSRSAKIAALRKQVTEGESLIKREKSVRGRWEQMRSNTLPADTSIAEQKMVQAFNTWSQKSRITVTSIAPQLKHDAEDYMTLQCRMDASGNLFTLSQFLFDLEKDPMAVKIDSMTLTARDNEGQLLTLALQVSGLILTPQQGQK